MKLKLVAEHFGSTHEHLLLVEAFYEDRSLTAIPYRMDLNIVVPIFMEAFRAFSGIGDDASHEELSKAFDILNRLEDPATFA